MGIKNVSAALQISELAESIRRDFGRSSMPSSLASMIDVSRSYQDMADRFAGSGLGKVGDSIAQQFGLGRYEPPAAALARDLHHRFAASADIIGAAGQLAELQRSVAASSVGSPLNWETMRRAVDGFGAGTFAELQLTRFAAFDRTLHHALAEPAYLDLSKHMRETALGSVGLLRQDWPVAIGFLTQIEDRGAIVTWLAPHRKLALLMTAALTDEANLDPDSAEEGLPLDLEAEYICAICEGPMLTFGREVRWLGTQRAIVRRRIFPTCPSCREEEARDAGFLYRALSELTRPAVEIVRSLPGGRQGDGRPRGRLRLVRKDP